MYEYMYEQQYAWIYVWKIKLTSFLWIYSQVKYKKVDISECHKD